MPGAGKTTTGVRLEKLGWTHFDCEKTSNSNWFQNPKTFLPNATNVVLSWGFLPHQERTLNVLLELGYVPVWFGGRREYLLESLRGRGESAGFLDEPVRVDQHKGLRLVSCDMVLNTFRPDGSRWDVATFLHDVYWEVEGAS
jgi:hypothetical protein